MNTVAETVFEFCDGQVWLIHDEPIGPDIRNEGWRIEMMRRFGSSRPIEFIQLSAKPLQVWPSTQQGKDVDYIRRFRRAGEKVCTAQVRWCVEEILAFAKQSA